MELKDKSKKSRGKGNALVLIDVINDFDFPLAEALLRYALPAALHWRKPWLERFLTSGRYTLIAYWPQNGEVPCRRMDSTNRKD
jgi:hypothetical protein